MRRDPATIFAAHALDPSRCDLYVEGSKDRRFLEWLLGEERHTKASVVEIAFVELSGAEGGERERLLAFASIAEGDRANIRFLADADFDRIFRRAIRPNVWLTDPRDMEGYLLRADCIDKVWRLGLGREVNAAALIESVAVAARTLGAMRLLSRERQLELPFQRTVTRKRVTASATGVTINRSALLGTLLQNADVSLSCREELLERTSELEGDPPDPEDDVLHGKDCLVLLAEVLAVHGVSRDDAERMLWVSFERHMVDDYATLSDVVRYLRTCAR